jgi:pimeloyl-ACP methyl ester carboxylesterase
MTGFWTKKRIIILVIVVIAGIILGRLAVRAVFEGVGPSSFYPDDWTNYGFDKDKEAAAGIFSVMRGDMVTPEMFGTVEYDELMKPISALLNIDENTVPTVMAYGRYDTFQPYLGSVRLEEALSKAGVDHKYILFEHSGHGLQNDNKQLVEYSEAILEYLDKYMEK